MFKESSTRHYETGAEGGVRHLFDLGGYLFQDTLDAEDGFHHFIVETEPGDVGPSVYEVDRETMYEFMARFLAGEHELEEYELERSPAHEALLDVLEIATARARSGESEFSWEEFDQSETEVRTENDDEDTA